MVGVFCCQLRKVYLLCPPRNLQSARDSPLGVWQKVEAEVRPGPRTVYLPGRVGALEGYW